MLLSIYPVEVPPAPVDVKTLCTVVIWRNAPNISYEDISGYDVRLINLDTHQDMIQRVDASATFYSLDSIEDESFQTESTAVQVHIQGFYQNMIS